VAIEGRRRIEGVEVASRNGHPIAGWLTWTSALQAIALVGLAYAYRPLLTLGTRWSFSQGVEYWLFRPGDNAPVIIIVLCAWLFYRRWWRLRKLPRAAGPVWLIAGSLVLGLSVYLWARYTRADDLFALSLAFNMVGLVTLHWGLPGLRALWLPIAFLLFCIPAPAPLLLAVIWKLQLWTAEYAGWMLYVLGLPALVSGDIITRASQSFQVIEGCSGLRSVEILTMLAVLLVDLFRRTGIHAVILVVLAPFIAFALNGLRVLTLILNPHSEIVAIHNLQGIAILLVGLLIIYGIDGLIERHTKLDSSPSTAPSPRSGAQASLTRGHALVVLVTVGLVTPLSVFAVPVWQPPAVDRTSLGPTVDAALEGWPSTDREVDLFFWGSARFSQVVYEGRQTELGEVDLWIGVSDFGQRGGSAMSPKTALPGPGWRVREVERMGIGAAGVLGEEHVIEKGKQRLLVRHWYSGTRGLVSELSRNLLALDRSWLYRERPMLVTRLSTPLTSRDEAARAEARARLDLVYERLSPALDRLRE
jgi:exosortase